MDAQVFLNITSDLMSALANWPIWALIALATSTLHLGLVADLFDKTIKWRLLPGRLIWSSLFFLIAAVVITTIDASPDYAFLGLVLSILAAFNLIFHVTRGMIGQHENRSKDKAASTNSNHPSTSGSESDMDGVTATIILVGLLGFAFSYVLWPVYAGEVAEAAFIEDAQIVRPLDDGTMMQTVLVAATEDSGNGQLVFSTSAGDFSIARTPATIALKKEMDALHASTSDRESSLPSRGQLITVIWKIDDANGMKVIDLRAAF